MTNFFKKKRIALGILGSITVIGVICIIASAPAVGAVLILVGIAGLGLIGHNEFMKKNPTF